MWLLKIKENGNKKCLINLLNAEFSIIQTSQSICYANQLTGFYMMAALTLNELMVRHVSIPFDNKKKTAVLILESRCSK